MKKLQKGDYVRNLTEEQWNELLDIEDKSYFIRLTWFDENIMISDGQILISSIVGCNIKNELTFEEFKQRAINTYKS